MFCLQTYFVWLSLALGGLVFFFYFPLHKVSFFILIGRNVIKDQFDWLQRCPGTLISRNLFAGVKYIRFLLLCFRFFGSSWIRSACVLHLTFWLSKLESLWNLPTSKISHSLRLSLLETTSTFIAESKVPPPTSSFFWQFFFWVFSVEMCHGFKILGNW